MQAVETNGVICPLRIAEIMGAVVKGVGFQRRPGRVGKACGDFHHDNHADGSSDVESKLICPHTNIRSAELHLRNPQHRWTPSKCRAPARGALQIIDGEIVVTVEDQLAKAGGVALEIDSRKLGAVLEGGVSDGGDAGTDRHAGEVAAGRES